MSNEDRYHTTSWDGGQVRRQAAGEPSQPSRPSGGSGKKKAKKKRTNPFLALLLWVVVVIASSVILAGVGWMLACDLCAFNRGAIETVTVEARKEWKAAAFQADFEDAAVELTLQSRPKGSEDDAWTDTDETLVMGNFRSEHLINTGAATVPKYDAEGHELEYRWEETGVYQNVDGETIGENAENLMGDGGAFTMTHTVDNTSGGADDPETVDRAIDYQATTESGSRGDGVYYTNVTNAPANKINYTIEKIWLDEDGNNVTDSKEPTDLTFYLYRSINGSPISEASIGRVTMDGQPDAQSTELELQTAPGCVYR